MEQKHLGVDLSVLGSSLQLAVLLEGQDLTGIEEISCVVKDGDTDWVDYPLSAGGDDFAFGDDDAFLLKVPKDCRVTVADIEILKLQKLVEDAGYQWQEHFIPGVGEKERYLVAVTRSLLSSWTPASPNVLSWTHDSRLASWKRAAEQAGGRVAAGSAGQRREQHVAEKA